MIKNLISFAALLGLAQALQPVTIFPTSYVSIESLDNGVESLVGAHLGQPKTWSNHYDYELISANEINGHRFEKYVQVSNGVRVKDSEVVLHINDQESVESVIGHATTDIVNPVAALSNDDAILAFQAAYPMLEVLSQPALAILDGYLVYEAVVQYVENDKVNIGRLSVDANDGTVRGFQTTVYGALNRKIHQYPDKCTFFWVNNVPGELIVSEGGQVPADDPKARFAYDNMGIVYNFYKKMFNRDSFDDKGHALVGTIDMLYTDKMFGKECGGDNAAWVGDPYNQMIYFIDGQVFKDIEGDLTVVSHEMTHAVTDKTSSLVYKDESGALNEAVSDVFGVGAKIWLENGGSIDANPTEWKTTEKSYWVGEDAVTDAWPNPALRFMNNPTLDGRSPDNYDDIKRGTEDNGYVHSNSGIFNMFFYLLAEGGKHPRIESNEVQGVGVEKALRMVYEANTKIFTSGTTFEQARHHVHAAAKALFGEHSPETHSVHQAMDAVRVPQGARSGSDKAAPLLRGGLPVQL